MARQGIDAVQLGNLLIDLGRGDGLVDGRPIGLTYVELELLARLAHQPGKVVQRYQLAEVLTHNPRAEHSVPLNVHISRLRKKLRESDPWSIKTVRKRGYMLTETESSAAVPIGDRDHELVGASVQRR